MDLEEAARLVAERVDGKESVDVGVKVELVPAGWLDVHVHSRNPVLWFHAGVNLHADGRVSLPPSDDGCTPVSLGPVRKISQPPPESTDGNLRTSRRKVRVASGSSAYRSVCTAVIIRPRYSRAEMVGLHP